MTFKILNLFSQLANIYQTQTSVASADECQMFEECVKRKAV